MTMPTPPPLRSWMRAQFEQRLLENCVATGTVAQAGTVAALGRLTKALAASLGVDLPDAGSNGPTAAEVGAASKLESLAAEREGLQTMLARLAAGSPIAELAAGLADRLAGKPQQKDIVPGSPGWNKEGPDDEDSPNTEAEALAGPRRDGL